MDYPRPRVLVTGLSGFTGRHVAAALTVAGYEVHGTVRPGEPAGPRQHIVDLTDIGGIRRVVETVRPRHVVHLAAVAFVAHDDVDAMYRTNIVGTRNLLHALSLMPNAAQSLGTVLVASSANVYGNTEADPIREVEPLRPANDYAVSKVAMEQMADLWRDRLPITIVRPFNYTGVGQSKNFLIPKIVDAFARRAPVLELGNLDVYREFSDVRDVVQGYVSLLDLSPRTTVNICSGEVHSLREVISLASDISRHTLEVRVNPAFVRSNEIRILRGSTERLRTLLPDWHPRALRDVLEWMLSEAVD